MTRARPAVRPARLLALLFAALAAAQEPAPAPAPAEAAPTEEQAPAPLVPGALPADAEPAARELWQRFVAAEQTSERVGPVESFEVRFALRSRNGVQSNDLVADLAWRAPSAVRFAPDGQPAIGRNAAGRYWMRDRDEVVWYEGRDYVTDREEIDDALDLARTFARLADPTRLRLASLRVLERAPRGLPKADGLDPKALVWLALESPDFAIATRGAPRRAGPPALDRVELGLDRETLTPRVARVTPLEAPKAPAPPPPGEPRAPAPVIERVFVLDDVRPLGRRRVPHVILVHERVLSATDPVGSGQQPSQELFLQRGRFDVELADRVFEPLGRDG